MSRSFVHVPLLRRSPPRPAPSSCYCLWSPWVVILHQHFSACPVPAGSIICLQIRRVCISEMTTTACRWHLVPVSLQRTSVRGLVTVPTWRVIESRYTLCHVSAIGACLTAASSLPELNYSCSSALLAAVKCKVMREADPESYLRAHHMRGITPTLPQIFGSFTSSRGRLVGVFPLVDRSVRRCGLWLFFRRRVI